MRMPPVEIPERPPEERRRDFGEVALGYDEAAAVAEAQRCLVCAHPTCVQGCPVGVRIDEFVAAVAAGEFDRAAAVVAEDNSLPAVCGRVCPQEVQCEGACVMARKGRAIHIGALERFVADRWARRQEA
ncbi:MAG: dihydropyrimidine dehydrogenase, partial [Actinomyces sp.]